MSLPESLAHIHAVAATACGGCVPSPQGCGKALGVPCAEPELRGEPLLLQRALAALRGVVEPEQGHNLVDLQLVQALRIEGGEAELTLTYPRGCGAARLMAEAAFQALRGALPDTDIYVGHAE
jgi:metal-sulfur cluster biosynthetic enzyme